MPSRTDGQLDLDAFMGEPQFNSGVTTMASPEMWEASRSIGEMTFSPIYIESCITPISVWVTRERAYQAHLGVFQDELPTCRRSPLLFYRGQ